MNRLFSWGFVVSMLGGSLASCVGNDRIWPLPDWERTSPAEAGLHAATLEQARDYALAGGGSGAVIRQGRLVFAWGDLSARYDLKSTSKSIGVTALGLAIADGKISLNDPVFRHHPTFAVPPEENARTGWIEKVTIRHLATHTAGFEKPGGYTKLAFEPGTTWAYSDGGPNWLAECITLAYRQDVETLLFERIFTPLGISREGLRWRANAYRDHRIDGVMRREFGSGVHASVDAMARIGYLYLREGEWNGQQLLPREFVRTVRHTDETIRKLPVHEPRNYGEASRHYGLLWWNNQDGTLKSVPRDAYWSWGLYDSLIVVIPSLDIVVARAGQSLPRGGDGHYDVLKPFLEPIVASVVQPVAAAVEAPYPPSPVIERIDWAPPESIIRQARGSDNWPLTWGDDDRLYTAYGDGWGFEPRVDRKLSLGLAVIDGGPDGFQATNLRTRTAERVGDGRHGEKASGLLMVDGVLYLLARNAGNSRLAWSEDRGQTWTWCDWTFTTSFGCPTFLNFGRNYAGARDEFVYVYSHDQDSAYERADRMVLARVPKDRIRELAAYEYFAGQPASQDPRWTKDVNERTAVFEHPGGCYRSSVTYCAPLKRYLWCQTGAGDDPRFRGGLAIYDAPEPWGPWTTAFFAQEWDVGPGETSSLPAKWISPDGRTVHLVFSGEDTFSVRRGTIVPRTR